MCFKFFWLRSMDELRCVHVEVYVCERLFIAVGGVMVGISAIVVKLATDE